MIGAMEGLERLREGNLRFVSGQQQLDHRICETRRAELAEGQRPFAVVLGCSDSRVPVEMIFDQGVGALFVIRVAGNIVAPSLIGSVEFAAEQFGIRLVVVLGHTRCGAIAATLDQLQRPTERQSANLHSIVDRIRPSVEGLLASDLKHDAAALAEAAVRSNVRYSTEQLRHGSVLLEERIERGDLLVVGAEYSLETGLVDFFHGVRHSVEQPRA